MSIAHDGMTWDELADKIENEGFDYFFMYYTSPQADTDPKLATLWDAYTNATANLKDYINDNADESEVE